MAKRPFQPNALGLNKDFFANVIEQRLRHSGEYVYHLPQGENRQAVVMNFQHMPSEKEIHDFLLSSTNPVLYGYIDHFNTYPSVYKGANKTAFAEGSQFEVRGIIYNTKRVDVNHRGYVAIELTVADKCTSVRKCFTTEVDALLCKNSTTNNNENNDCSEYQPPTNQPPTIKKIDTPCVSRFQIKE